MTSRRQREARTVGPGLARTAAYDAGTPRRAAPRIDIRSVPCPTCNAQPNEPCLNLGLRTGPQDRGKPCSSPHPTRKRMATRAYNARRAQKKAES